MPCWQVRTIEIDFARADIGLLREALESLGFRVYDSEKGLWFRSSTRGYGGSFETSTGRLVFNVEVDNIESDIRTAYSAAAINRVSKQFSTWKVKQTSKNEYVFERGY